MDLSEALKAHLSCSHSLIVKRVGDEVSVRHRKDATMRFEIFSYQAGGGSHLFHRIARHLMREESHKRTPMIISDEEYAGFVEA